VIKNIWANNVYPLAVWVFGSFALQLVEVKRNGRKTKPKPGGKNNWWAKANPKESG